MAKKTIRYEVGFIGLGIMGAPMAGHLVTARYRLHVYDLIEERAKDLAARGAKVCKNAREVAARSDVLFLMLPDTPDVADALFGPDGVAPVLRPGSVVVDMSSISPIETRRFAERLLGQGVEMLDAPVSGGQIGAQSATPSIMVGGKPEVFERIRPFFEKMGKGIVHIGGNGDGQVCKVANQIVVAVTIEAVGEALLLASRAGADPVKVREALLGGFAAGKVLEIHGERMITRAFQPGSTIRLHQKDLNLALQAGRNLGVSLPATATAQELFTAAGAAGCLDLDHSAMVLALERLVGCDVAGGK
ncbi:MAG: 2-hydroxy-3-oxopropionate reductase [Syntrophorhabdales bacterium]